MSGPYEFTSEEIDRVVTKSSPGNYALGNSDEKTFYVHYVGRSDNDVNQELKAKLDLNHKEFKYSYAASPKSAFEKECHNYHDFGGSNKLDNKIHPGRPSGISWICPVCSVFG